MGNWSGFDNHHPENPDQAPFGDFECHRTWMTVATHLPIEKWYTNSSLSNVSYWPMDYPPLCMEMHYIMGKSIEVLEPAAFETQGYEEPRYRWIMRTWVILVEYLIFVPAAIYFLKVVNGKVTPWALMVITCIPSTMLVDNVHF